ncbi:hypothetical protein [Gimesia maris]|uniref:hypothetical protein n=1 Tax=Gimesia maris TaxID=122 RepID=UPI0032EDECE2
MKAKLQQDTVKSIVEQLKKSPKVEFDSSLMTAEEFADCYRAAEALVKAAPKVEPKKDVK